MRNIYLGILMFLVVFLINVGGVLAACGDGVCEANECASKVDGKVECSQDCKFQCDDGCDNNGDGKLDAANDNYGIADRMLVGETTSQMRENLNNIGYTTHPEYTKKHESFQDHGVHYSTYIYCDPKWGDQCVVSMDTVVNSRNVYGYVSGNGDTTDKLCDLNEYSSASYVINSKSGQPRPEYIISTWIPELNNFEVRNGNVFRGSGGSNILSLLICKDPVNSEPACSDGIDNDGDDKIDFGDNGDDGCESADDVSEYENDPGCNSLVDNDESSTQCSDGIDNEGDGNTDALEFANSNNVNNVVKRNTRTVVNTAELEVIDFGAGASAGGKISLSEIFGYYGYRWCSPKPSYGCYEQSVRCDTENKDRNRVVAGPVIEFFDKDNKPISRMKVLDADDIDIPVGTVKIKSFFDEAEFPPGQYSYLNSGCSFKTTITRPVADVVECSNGIDDDGDGKIDAGEGGDDGCENANDISEKSHDPDCDSPTDPNEGPGTQCSDGIDNDGDEKKDLADPNCDDENDDNEFPDVPQCYSKKTVLRLSKEKDGLGGVFNTRKYYDRVCYNTIFDKNPTNEDPHACVPEDDPKNVVLWLSKEDDSLASTRKTDEYDIPICYDRLVCRVVDTSNNEQCNGEGEKVVVSLKTLEGSTISKTIDSDFPIQVCCSVDTTSLNFGYWSDMKGDEIPSSKVVDLKDKVKLVVDGINIDETTVKYTIYEKCLTIPGCVGNLFTGDEIVVEETVQGEYVWNAGEKIEDNSFSGGQYYFTAEIENVNEIDSRDKADVDGILTVSDTEDNSRPEALIVFPEHREIYFYNSPIRFEQGSFDLDDEFSYVWDMGDGTTREGNSENLENYIFDYVYDDVEDKGQIDIKLTVTDDRGESDTAQVSILVIDSTFIFSSIDKPVNGESYGRIVNYDARGSYAVSSETVIESDGTCGKVVTCLAGNCPEKTKGCPTSESLGCDYIGSCPVDVDETPKLLDKITFCWVYDGKTSEEECKVGSEGALFTKEYPKIGVHDAVLTTKIDV